MKNLFLLMAIVLLLGNASVKSAVFVDATVVAKGVSHKLLFSIPDDYNKANKYSMVVALHKVGGTALAYRKNLQPITDSLKMIVVCPDNSGQAFTDAQFDVITASIDSAKTRYNLDEQSVFLNGMSMNATYALHEGLKNLYPFKGVFAWAPYQPTINAMDLNTQTPVVISIGTSDEYGTGSSYNLYDSLKVHGANVNLVILPGISHTSDFPAFGNEMIRCLYYLNNAGNISIQKVNDSGTNVTMTNADPAKEIEFKVSHKLDKELTVSSLSSLVAVVPNPETTYNPADGMIKLKLKPAAGKTGTVIVILEVREKNGIGIKQITFNVKVTKSITGIDSKVSNTHLEIYPNPSSDRLYLNCKEQNLNVVIYDLKGNLIMKGSAGNQTFMDVSNLSPGMYFLKAMGKENYKPVKFSKQ